MKAEHFLSGVTGGLLILVALLTLIVFWWEVKTCIKL